MCKLLVGVCVALSLMIGCSADAYAAAAQVSPSLARPEPAVAPVDDTATFAFPDVSKIDPRLAFLGAGALLGMIIASPGLELSEVLGIALGVVGSQYLYYSLAPRPSGPLRPNP